MTLRQKISWQVGTTLVGLVLVSGAALWGINALHEDYGVALEGYQRLRQAYVAGTHLQTAQKLLQWSHPQSLSAARAEVQAAITNFAAAGDPLDRGPIAPGIHPAATPPASARSTATPATRDSRPAAVARAGWDVATADDLRHKLELIADNLELLESAPGGPAADAVEAQRDAVVAQIGRIAELSAGIRRATESAQSAADQRRRSTFALVGGLCGLVVLLAVVFGVLHYRGVMLPIGRLSAGVRAITRGHFKGRIETHGRDELASLASDFNTMAAELDGFYHELERKVADKSRELIRSERLASVGYLAAGVAHEINNPLGIISGYAEYAIAEMDKRDPGGQTAGAAIGDGEPRKSLEVIRDEAFRCKQITQKLLSLARGGDDGRQPTSLLNIAREVASIVGALKEHRQTRVVVSGPDAGPGGVDPTIVMAVEPEMKQVLLNLAVNALEAVPAPGGQVRIDVRPVNGMVELSVADNGRGMSAQTLERVFEPFFTQKRGRGEGDRHGTGLGLSITHAIVQNHGGTIVAQSEGAGKGSRFVVRMPGAVSGT